VEENIKLQMTRWTERKNELLSLEVEFRGNMKIPGSSEFCIFFFPDSESLIVRTGLRVKIKSRVWVYIPSLEPQ
jgi:hypothetical protein